MWFIYQTKEERQIYKQCHEETLAEMNQLHELFPPRPGQLDGGPHTSRDLITEKYSRKYDQLVGEEHVCYRKFPCVVEEYPKAIEDMTMDDYVEIERRLDEEIRSRPRDMKIPPIEIVDWLKKE